MKVLVTGGTGVVGKAAVDRLVERGHSVRLVSRHASDDAQQWPTGVEPRPGDVGDPDALRGAADGCDAVLHVAGIVAESPPEVTFERVNVQGTRNLVAEANRAGVRRFVHVSSLGAERGSSDYHRSKAAGEEAVRGGFAGAWTVIRPGNVYGPGDEVISLLFKMVRTLPAVPVIGGGDQPFQPVWVDDLAEALVRLLERDDLAGASLDLAGPETTTVADLLDRMEAITDRKPVRVPVPEMVAKLGVQAAELVGMALPVTDDQLVMLAEENLIPPGQRNALTDVLGVTPTSLDEGLRRLADSIPEKLPSEGTGHLHRERFWADIRGSRLSPEELLLLVRHHFAILPPESLVTVGAEPRTPDSMEEGATLTLAVPLRGNVQVRVEEATPRAISAVTVEGHFFAGVIRFVVEEPEPGVTRFEVRTYNRAANLFDRVALRTVGKVAQYQTWATVVQEIVDRSGGQAPDGVQRVDETMEEGDAKDVERWVAQLVMERKRHEAPGGEAVGGTGTGGPEPRPAV